VCTNAGHRERVVPAAWVDDGYCDCCDGSDERAGACANVCETAGEAARVEARAAAASILAGVKTRSEYVAEGLRIVARDTEALEKAKEKLAAVLDKLQDATSRLDQLDKLREHEQRLRALDNDSCAASFAENNDVVANSAVGVTVAAVTAAPSDAETSTVTTATDQLDPGAPEDALEGGEGVVEGNALVDSGGDESTQDVSAVYDAEEPADVSDAPLQLDQDSICAELSRNSSVAVVRKVQYYQALLLAKVRRWAPKLLGRVAGPDSDVVDASSCHGLATHAKSKLETEKQELESSIRNLESRTGADYGSPDGAMRKLHGTCIKQRFAQYEFELCLFESVAQYENGNRIAGLGTWGQWDGLDTMSYNNGEQCWNGPQRSTRVTIECGEKDEIVSVDEPNRCAYLMRFRTPAACERAQADAVLTAVGMSVDGEKTEL
jgi:protein kinase C substrate 80K-H